MTDFRTGNTDGRSTRVHDMERIPILEMAPFLLVTVQGEMQDRQAKALEEDLLETIRSTRSKGVLIDITALEVLDTYLANALAGIASAASLLGASTVMTGMQPAVAMTLVELGVSLAGVETSLNVEKGMDVLRSKPGLEGAAHAGVRSED